MSRLSGEMYQETSEQNVGIYWQQQAGVERMKTGFDHAERSAETMNSHLVNLHIKMDRRISMLENQMRRLQDIQKHLAAESQNITGSNIIRTLGGGISSIQRQDNTSMTNREYMAKIDKQLENLAIDIKTIDKKLDDLMGGVQQDMDELKKNMDRYNISTPTERLDAPEQRATELQKKIEVTLAGMSFDQAQQDFDRCEARTQTDQKLDSILKYMAGFESEMSGMSTKVKEMKAAIGAMARMSFRKSINGDV